MTRFFGKIGYASAAEEISPGIYDDVIIERSYYGDVVRNAFSNIEAEKVNADIRLGNSFSIVADAYAMNHFHTMVYLAWAGTLWSITNVDEQSPRLILRIGGVYNGPTPIVPDAP